MLRRVLLASRYLMVVPVVGSLLLTAGAVAMGLGGIVLRGQKLVLEGDFSLRAAKAFSVTVVETIDLFLVAAVGYITAVGLYRLFISNTEDHLLDRVRIETLNDLESKIIGVVIAALAVTFLGKVVEALDPMAVLQMGLGIALVIAGLCLYVRLAGTTGR
jgi:uncharacterized membrane protein YqhA